MATMSFPSVTGRASLLAGRRLSSRVVDWAPALALCAIGVASIAGGGTHEGPRALTVPVALVATLALAARRRAPVAAASAVMAAWVVQSIAADSPAAVWELIVLIMAAYAPGAHADGRRALAGLVIVLAGVTVIVALDDAPDASAFTPFVLGGGPWVAGRLVRRHWAQARQLDALNAELERRRQDDVAAATRHERARIARELHDVIAHSIGVMVVQAGAAEQVLGDRERTAETLHSIRRTGKGALAEMRRLVGVLRTDDAETAAHTPQPGLGDVPALVERLREAGLNARLCTLGEPADLTPGADLAAYRVVQEALTNALKHGDGGPVDVTVRHQADAVELEVVNGTPASRDEAPGGGHGLIGMRERVALYGGTLDAGPRPGGGWAVSAQLPVDAAGAP